MKYSIDKQEKYHLFSLEEEKLDTTIAPDLKSEFVTASAEGVPNMIVDLGKVKYIDSSGLSALLVGNRVFSDNSGAFIIASPTEHVMKLIKISQLNNVLNILPSAEEAVDAVFMHELEKDFKQDDETAED
jgi:anti-anti-sigma factor